MKRTLFRTRIRIRSAFDRMRGRALAINAVLTPSETSRGTQSSVPDTAISFPNALVKIGATDREFTPVTAASDIPLGILQNDAVTSSDVTSAVPKVIALLGLYPESLPAVASGAIAALAEVVADVVTPGYVKQLPSASGTYVVIGRARRAVASAGDPVSIIHEVPRVTTF
jgi:hypothetical protein